MDYQSKCIPYHNVAIDETHECVINKRLKQICCRPSNFRTVQLADFMAYLDVVVSGLENHLSKFKSQASKYTKRYVCERVTILKNLIENSPLFKISSTERVLENIFAAKPKTLDGSARSDLLNFFVTGKELMLTYVKQNLLVPTIEPAKRVKKT